MLLRACVALQRVSSCAGARSAMVPLLTAQQVQRIAFSTGAQAGADEKSPVIRNAEKMVELMSTSPQLQEMMLAAMPAPFRSSGMLKMVLQDPRMKTRIAEMIAKQGMAIPQEVLDKISAENLEATFTKAEGAGLNPVQLFNTLIHHPDLLAKLRDPRVMSAFMDVTKTPSNLAKYQSEPEIVEVVQRVRDILSSQRPATGTTPPSEQLASSEAATGATSSTDEAPAPAQTSSSSSSDATSGEAPASLAQAEAEGLNPMLLMLASNPATSHHAKNPRVVEALKVISKSPWKAVKYVLDKEVTAALSDCKKIMQGKSL